MPRQMINLIPAVRHLSWHFKKDKEISFSVFTHNISINKIYIFLVLSEFLSIWFFYQYKSTVLAY